MPARDALPHATTSCKKRKKTFENECPPVTPFLIRPHVAQHRCKGRRPSAFVFYFLFLRLSAKPRHHGRTCSQHVLNIFSIEMISIQYASKYVSLQNMRHLRDAHSVIYFSIEYVLYRTCSLQNMRHLREAYSVLRSLGVSGFPRPPQGTERSLKGSILCTTFSIEYVLCRICSLYNMGHLRF